jgi:hypothetical protein
MHAFLSATFDKPNRGAMVLMGSVQTSSYSSARVNRVPLMGSSVEGSRTVLPRLSGSQVSRNRDGALGFAPLSRTMTAPIRMWKPPDRRRL